MMMKSMMNVAVIAVVLTMTATENIAYGWVHNYHHHSNRMIVSSYSYFDTSLDLTPSQAQELADCAHDLMKQAMEEKAATMLEGQPKASAGLANDISKKLTMDAQDEECRLINDEEICGPMSWARKRLFRPFRHGGSAATTAAASTSKMP
jgi:hypothetical protein